MPPPRCLQTIRAWLSARFSSWRAAWFPAAANHPPLTAKMKTGMHGEDLAARHLRKLSWKIVARNWREGRDELDIVARDAGTLVFVEVKTRVARHPVPAGGDAGNANARDGASAPANLPLAERDTGAYEAVDARKRRALSRAIHAYLRALPRPVPRHRFDILEVILDSPTSPAPEIRHHKHIPLSARRG